MGALRAVAVTRAGIIVGTVNVDEAFTNAELAASFAPYGFGIDPDVFAPDENANPVIDATIRTWVDFENYLPTLSCSSRNILVRDESRYPRSSNRSLS